MTKISIPHPLKFLFLSAVCVLIGCSGVQLGPSQNAAATPRAIAKTMIAFAVIDSHFNQLGIYVVNADGTDLKQITKDGIMPTWSPDASQIAYRTFADNEFAISVVNADGSNNRHVAGIGLNPNIGDPVWAPIGRQIAFEVAKDNPTGPPILVIQIANLDQNNKIEIPCANTINCSFPNWSTDARYLLMSYFDQEHAPTNIGLVDLTKGTSYQTIQKNAALPKWQPHGDKIAVYAERNGVGGIYLMNRDGSQVQLVVAEKLEEEFVWSPDGTRLAFVSVRDPNDKSNIYIVDVDSKKLVRLTDDPAIDISPTWSPDGKQIAFRSKRDGHFEIYVVNADGTNLRRLTNSPDDKFDAVWSPR